MPPGILSTRIALCRPDKLASPTETSIVSAVPPPTASNEALQTRCRCPTSRRRSQGHPHHVVAKQPAF